MVAATFIRTHIAAFIVQPYIGLRLFYLSFSHIDSPSRLYLYVQRATVPYVQIYEKPAGKGGFFHKLLSSCLT